MPTTYFWPVAASSSSSSGDTSSSASGVGTGVDGRKPYAFVRKLNPQTGDVVFDQLRSSWALGAPVMERVLRCLRTERGTARRDPSYGVDWSQVDNARTGVAAIAVQAIRVGLSRFGAEVADLVVQAEVQAHGGGGKLLAIQLSFKDPRGATIQLSGRRI